MEKAISTACLQCERLQWLFCLHKTGLELYNKVVIKESGNNVIGYKGAPCCQVVQCVCLKSFALVHYYIFIKNA